MKILRKIFVLIIIISISLTPIQITKKAQAANPDPFFTISILAPNTNPLRNQVATLIVEQLPKIGIGIDVFNLTGWSQISPRTLGYPGPYPIPTYAEGGYDVFFMGWASGLDVDFRGLFDSPSIIPKW
ncbi:MAG: hypothetical protein HZR80_16570 [Candidatus Heimdallarchaeota archaeon]